MLSPYEKETYFNFNEAEKEAVISTYNSSLILSCFARRNVTMLANKVRQIVPCNGTDSQIEKRYG